MRRCITVLFGLLAGCATLRGDPVVGIVPNALTQTQSLQAAIDSGARLVLVPPGTWEVDSPIWLRSDQIIVFESGAILIAAEGAFKGPNDSLLMLENLDRVKIYANGAVFRMRKADYLKKPAVTVPPTPPDYVESEFRHAVDLRGSRDVRIEGGTFADSGGDGIYLGAFVKPGEPRVPNERISILGVTCDNNLRQGISVVSCVHCLIEDSVLSRTSGRSPQAGIDVEPEWGDRVDVTIHGCRSDGNRGPAFMWSLQKMAASDPPVKIVMLECTYAAVPADQPMLRMTGIYNDETKPTGYLKANLPKDTLLQWDTLVLRK